MILITLYIVRGVTNPFKMSVYVIIIYIINKIAFNPDAE